MLSKAFDLIFQIILFFLFYLVLTPIGFILRRLGKNYLSTGTGRKAATYWITRSSNPTAKIGTVRND